MSAQLALVDAAALPAFTVSWADDGSPLIRWEPRASLQVNGPTLDAVEAAGHALLDLAHWMRWRAANEAPWPEYIRDEFERRRTNVAANRRRDREEARERRERLPWPCVCGWRGATARGRSAHFRLAKYGTHGEAVDPPDTIRAVR